ncbi:zona pellucida sperm-binding protein 3 [Microcaecilia unicolor]|uniref:Zona pellucida sperm-binding protein 3 n=1 Tax=Microcaecilia unicolor TaxID=1415580 RepID=A0A6P7WWY9_9AMPH|nr:zona pellucida sperm-binding protein 3-like [Microcaecilia unicolor]
MGFRRKLGFLSLLWLITDLTCAGSMGSLQRDSLAGTPSEHRPHGVHVPWLGPSRPLDGRPHPVTVQCKEAKIVIIVRRDLFGTGLLIKATDLSLGPASCRPTISGTGETVTFEVGLHECGSILQMTPESLIYSTHLSYNPVPSGSQVIVRSNPAVIPVQCTYPRTGNVSSKAINPTWVPFGSTIFAEEKLDFSLLLMNDNWTAERTSTVFHLGDELHIEASVSPGDHVPMTIFVDSCVATLSPDEDSSPRYNIVDFYGCLVDGKQLDSSSTFRSPRTQPEKLQFTVDAFRFAGDTKSLIYITCTLRAAAADQIPDPLHKACSFNTSTMWSAVEGPSTICNCCKTENCGVPEGLPRGMRPFFPVPRRVGKRSVTYLPEVSESVAAVQLRPITILKQDALDQSYAVLRTRPSGVVENPWLVVGLVMASLALALSAAFGIAFLHKKCKF